MDQVFTTTGDRGLVALVDQVVDALTDDRIRLDNDADTLALVLDGLRVVGRLQAWVQRLAARVEASEAAWNEERTSTVTWLTQAARLTLREARHLIRAGQDMQRFPIIGQATLKGAVSPTQAQAITAVLGNLPDDLGAGEVTAAQESMVGFATQYTSAELRRLSTHLLEVVSPDQAETLEARRLERERRIAERGRYLEYHGDGAGSGRVPVSRHPGTRWPRRWRAACCVTPTFSRSC